MNSLNLTVTSHTHVSSSPWGRAKNFRFVLSLWLGAGLSVSVFGGSSAHALQINFGDVQTTPIGDVVITDNNGTTDLDGAVGAIRFDSNAAPPKGFALPAGSSVSRVKGKVQLGGTAGGLVGLLGAPQILALTDFEAKQDAGAGIETLKVIFGHTFQIPAASPIIAADFIAGVIDKPGGLFTGVGDLVTWQGFVSNNAISPPEIERTTQSAPPGPMAVNGGHGPMRFTGGPPWTLKGELTVVLDGLNHLLSLPNSAEVSETVLPDPKPEKKFPFGIALALAVVAFLVALAFLWWRRSSAG